MDKTLINVRMRKYFHSLSLLRILKGPAHEAPAAMDAPIDEQTKRTVQQIPLLATRAGPRDGEAWTARLKEEYLSLIQYVKSNKAADNDWFTIESNKAGTRWTGKCWAFHNGLRYEFDLEFEV